MQVQSASNIQMDYMKLLVAQLQNQNPLEPLDNNEMASQLAQFSQLEQLESLNSNFAGVLSAATRSYANSLIGKKVSYFLKDELTGLIEKKTDIVNEVYNDDGGESILVIGRRTVGLENIANSLIGTEVSFLVETRPGIIEIRSDIVRNFYMKEGQTFLVTDNYTLGLEDVGNSLIGKEVSYPVETEWGTIEMRRGVVEEIRQINGEDLLVVGQPLSLEEVISVGN